MPTSPATRQPSMPTDDQVLASRTGHSNPLGKFTAEVKGFKLPEVTHEGAERLAHEAGMSLQEWVRELVMVRVHGVDMLATVHAKRLQFIAGMERE